MSGHTLIELAPGVHAKVNTTTFHTMKLGRYRWRVIRPNKHTYAYRVGPGNKLILMHRQIMSAKRGQMVDHKNRDGLDNTIENLRFATPGQNCANRAKDRDNTSGYKGVSWVPTSRQWAAKIVVEGERHYLGIYRSPSRAAKAHDRAAVYFHGEFAGLNFPDKVPRKAKGKNGCAPGCVSHAPKPTKQTTEDRRAAQRKWTLANPEKVAAAARRSYLKNRAKRLAYQKERQAAERQTKRA